MAKREPLTMAMNTRVLFVCMGNICRSPMAEGVFRHMIRQAGLDDVVKVESAGTHAFHAGEAPDKRAQSTAAKRGYDISDLRARQVEVGGLVGRGQVPLGLRVGRGGAERDDGGDGERGEFHRVLRRAGLGRMGRRGRWRRRPAAV